MERSAALRSHAGQPAFPGGTLDPEDGDPLADGPLAAALREAEEETGLDPDGVQLFGVLPKLYIPVSGFVVTPVLGWWRITSPAAPSIRTRPPGSSPSPWRISPIRDNPTLRSVSAISGAPPCWSDRPGCRPPQGGRGLRHCSRASSRYFDHCPRPMVDNRLARANWPMRQASGRS
ncbi:putative Nudix hydrolase NudL [Streptomyces hirsutus]